MKLFAFLGVATAMRVNTPAPGFVNEQGAYFADQSGDQSQGHQQQQPQLPQVQPPHSTQAPQPGQEDADRDWPQGRQYPRGEGKGRYNEQGGWWPDQNGDVGPPPPGPVTPPPGPVTPPPLPEIQTCTEVAATAPNGVFPMNDIQTCNLSNMLDQIVRRQLEHALSGLEEAKQRELQLAFTNAVNGWRSIADQGECSNQTNNGQISNCGTICMGVKAHGKPDGFNETPEGFGATLDAFAQYIGDNFRSGANFDAAPEDRTACGNKVNAMFRSIKQFEEITGRISNLPNDASGWLED